MRFSTTAALLGLAVSGVVAAPFAEAEAEANGLSRRWQICFGEHGHCWDQGGKEEKCPPPPKKVRWLLCRMECMHVTPRLTNTSATTSTASARARLRRRRLPPRSESPHCLPKKLRDLHG